MDNGCLPNVGLEHPWGLGGTVMEEDASGVLQAQEAFETSSWTNKCLHLWRIRQAVD
jgi:hypothetical protein